MTKTNSVKIAGVPYWGGKGHLSRYILPMIPTDYQQYIEPFAGGASVFFKLAKTKNKLYVLNDKKALLTNFYYIAKTQQVKLAREICAYPYATYTFRKAKKMCEEGTEFDRAVGFYLVQIISYCSTGHSFGRALSKSTSTKRYFVRRNSITEKINALEYAQIEELDALTLIRAYDNKDAFFYIDPPYPDARHENYHKYTKDEFLELIDVLQNIKGKFILSCFESNLADIIIKRAGWQTKVLCLGSTLAEHLKQERLTWNFELCQKEFDF